MGDAVREELPPEARMGRTYWKVTYGCAELGVNLPCMTWRDQSHMVRLPAMETFRSLLEEVQPGAGKRKKESIWIPQEQLS